MRPGVLLAHLMAFVGLVIVTFLVFHATADDDSWYPRPPDDSGDDDGYLIATINVMLFVVPMELVVYLTALFVARRAASGPAGD